MERLLMFGLAGWILSCPGPSWRSEVSETASDFYTVCPCPGEARGGRASEESLSDMEPP